MSIINSNDITPPFVNSIIVTQQFKLGNQTDTGNIYLIPNIIIYVFVFTTFFWHTLFMFLLVWKSVFPSIANSEKIDEYIENESKIDRLFKLFEKVFLYFPRATIKLKNKFIEFWKSIETKKTVFFLFLLFFSLFRLIYFFMMIIISLSSNNNIIIIALNVASQIFYHTASTSFYIAFLTLSIIWTEEYLVAFSFAPDFASKVLRKPKLALILFVCIIVLIQFILSSLSIVSGIFVIKYHNSDYHKIECDPFYNTIEIAQLFCHTFMCLVVILFFISLTIFSRNKRMRGLDFESTAQYTLVNITICIISVIIVLRALKNFCYGVFQLVELIKMHSNESDIHSISEYSDFMNTIVIGVGALLLDFIPIALVIFSWENPISNSIKIEYEEKTPFNKGNYTPQRKYDSYRTPPLPTRSDTYDNDGMFINSI